MAVKQADEEAVAQDTTPGEVVRERRRDLEQLTQVYNIIFVYSYIRVFILHFTSPYVYIIFNTLFIIYILLLLLCYSHVFLFHYYCIIFHYILLHYIFIIHIILSILQ